MCLDVGFDFVFVEWFGDVVSGFEVEFFDFLFGLCECV